MIPLPVAPLTGVTVLVTRPEGQADDLCRRIEALGGATYRFPTIAIRALKASCAESNFHWCIFVSPNAVEHGVDQVPLHSGMRIAAIGKSTAAALHARGIEVNAFPSNDFTSEALLALPDLATIADQNVLIVKGEGGRDVLRQSLVERGARVTTLDVYRRALPAAEPDALAQLETAWRTLPIDIVTLTSVDIMENLLALVGESLRSLVEQTPFVTLSDRITAAARARGLRGDCVLARGADDEAISGAIAAWHARAR